ncbi:PAS domain-containing protein [Thalassobaculum sp.]|uniref:PAS domain-containing protein n=1 Tax=Thalassobaculum sp. TaxID=2022740 RepID=UPI0032EBC996
MLKPEMFVSVNQPLDLSLVGEYPILSEVLLHWRCVGDGRPPQRIDPLNLPPKALPFLMLVDLEGTTDAVIRLAGTAACDIHGRELKGTSVHDFFGERDARLVLNDLHAVAESERPTLARRSYVSINGKPWSYIRLLLPLRPDGGAVTRILKALEPSRFVAVAA